MDGINETKRPRIEVVAAILCRDGEFFATQRGYGEFEGKWEFPGGKIEAGESHEGALKREIREELGINIEIDKRLCSTEYDYPTFHITLHFFLCSTSSTEIELREHKSACWLTSNMLDGVDWLPADKEAISLLKQISSRLWK